MAAMGITLGWNLPKLTAIMEDIFEDMLAMVITLEREMPILAMIMDDILEDMDMAPKVKILKNDLLKKKAITKNILEETELPAMAIMERIFLKLIAIIQNILENTDMAAMVISSKNVCLLHFTSKCDKSF